MTDYINDPELGLIKITTTEMTPAEVKDAENQTAEKLAIIQTPVE